MEMRCFRRLLNINYIDHITNEEVKRRIRLEIGQYEELLSTVKKRKLKWYGHVTRISGLSKTIMQGTVRGGRKRGGQRKRWEHNISEWTNLSSAETLRLAGDRSRKQMAESGFKSNDGAPTTTRGHGIGNKVIYIYISQNIVILYIYNNIVNMRFCIHNYY